MKKILITGANSYIGTSFERYATTIYPGEFNIETLDMMEKDWSKKDFSVYDCVFHVAGIAHADISHVTEAVKKKYYAVNRDLAIAVAEKAKSEGVGQFVFMSSMIVYGNVKHVSINTIPQPENFYGDSKWQADLKIQQMNSVEFCTAVLRPPMIYGKGSKGNYPVLAKMAKQTPVFPRVHNKRSMLYIENLCEFLCILISNRYNGIFFPQNEELIETDRMVREIAKVSRHKIWYSTLLGVFAKGARLIPGKIGNLSRKAFGDSYYDLSMSDIGTEYRIVDFSESIRRTEMKES